jgi:urease accessory protein
MLQIREKLNDPATPAATLTLAFDQRQKARLRTRLDNGEEVGLMLARGARLRGGDCLRAENGMVVQVRAAEERVSTAFSDNPLILARACYHLGNRHMPLQIGPNWLRYPRDHVLDPLVASLGLKVQHQTTPFEPEGGAYESAHRHAHHG